MGTLGKYGFRLWRVLTALLLVFALPCALSACGEAKGNSESPLVKPETVDSAVVFNGSTGKEQELSDPAEVEKLLSVLESASWEKEDTTVSTAGFSYEITLLDEDKNKLQLIVILGPAELRSEGQRYVAEGKMDMGYFESLFQA